MRIILTYGLDVTTGSVENRACLNKSVKESVRKLLGEIVEVESRGPGVTTKKVGPLIAKGQSAVPMKPGDWICPKCNFMNFAKNIKCLSCSGEFEERYQMLHEDQEHLPLKKGDWICKKCNFLNFAKNSKCLQCHEKPTDRNLSPGEWECPSCNYVNFRRNGFCLKCGWKRPKSLNNEDNIGECHDEEHSKHSAISFVEDGIEPERSQSLQRESLASEDSNFWSSEEGGSESDDFNFCARKDSIFLDTFPILGGTSALSQDPLAREKWKEKMLKSNKGLSIEDSTRCRDIAGSTHHEWKEEIFKRKKGLSSSTEESRPRDLSENPLGIPRSLQLDDFGDEDEMASWFTGETKNRKTENLP